jgi:hypothetical protein
LPYNFSIRSTSECRYCILYFSLEFTTVSVKRKRESGFCGLTYAVVDPGAVVVEYLDAVVAYRAVGAAGRPVELTRHAPLHPHLHTNKYKQQVKDKFMDGVVDTDPELWLFGSGSGTGSDLFDINFCWQCST